MSRLTDFMRDKWGFWMSVCALSHDDHVTSADLNNAAESLVDEYKLPGAQADLIKGIFMDLGCILLGQEHQSKDVSVTTNKVKSNLTTFLLIKRADAVEYFSDVLKHMFAAVDTDEDGFVNEKEFNSVCKCLLIKEKYWKNLYHRMRNPETGNVNTTIAGNWWVDFLMGVDEASWAEQHAVFIS